MNPVAFHSTSHKKTEASPAPHGWVNPDGKTSKEALLIERRASLLVHVPPGISRQNSADFD